MASEEDLTKDQIIEYLEANNYDKNLIKEAISVTGSLEMDVLLDYMDKKNTSSSDVNKNAHEMEQANANRLKMEAEMMQEKLYRENLIKRIEADRREKYVQEQAEISQGEKLKSAVVEKTWDYSIKVRTPTGRMDIFYLNKTDTWNTLYMQVSEKFQCGYFHLFKPNTQDPILNNDRQISEDYKPGVKFALFLE